MIKLLIVQPYLAQYRVPVFRSLAKHYEVTVAAGLAEKKKGFGTIDTDEGFTFKELTFRSLKGVEWQSGLCKLLFNKPNAVFIAANPRHLSYWFVLFFCFASGIDVFCHGQGPYNKSSLSVLRKAMYRLEFAIAKKYICYTEYSKQSFSDFGLKSNKLAVAENSLHLECPEISSHPPPEGLHLLFIGRLRSGSNLELLVDVMSSIIGCEMSLHVVGDGEMREYIEHAAAEHPWIHWHGSIYDSAKLAAVAENCVMGCYPGDAGLSILHYMALGLPTMAHDNISAHMGPEPSYIKNGVNGFLFDYTDKEASMKAIFEDVLNGKYDMETLAENAVATFRELTSPSLGERLHRILQEAGV